MSLAASLGLAAAWYGYAIESRRIQFRTIDLLLPHLPRAFDGYRLAHLTDLHLDGTPAAAARLTEAVAWVNAQTPDAIAITGDFVTLKQPADTRTLIDQLTQLRAPDGVFAVMGNHDHKRNRALVEGVIRASGLQHLCNRVHPITRTNAETGARDSLYLCGVDSVSRRRARLDRVLAALNRHVRDAENGADGDAHDAKRAACAILLAHEPDFADVSAATERFDLQLSGHAHGGQIRIPFVTRRVLPVYGVRYSNGLYLARRQIVVSNRGLGTTGIPIRFRCPPEVLIIRLRAQNG
jgi:predicted MPP superfamily phosphohydrolase